MNKDIANVLEFHKVNGAFIGNRDTYEKRLRYDVALLRLRLITEELSELEQAMGKEDIVEIADALGDILYVVYGTVIAFGLHEKMQEIFNEIHDSNMSKMGADGKPVTDGSGKVIKGPNYFKPQIREILFPEEIK